MGKTLTIRIDDNRYKVIETISEQKNVTQSEAIKELMDYGRVDLGIKLYSEEKLSLENAAKIAGISISDFLDEMKKRGIELNISLDDFKESLKHVKMLVKKNKAL